MQRVSISTGFIIIADGCKGNMRGSYPRGIRSIRMSATNRMA
nr:MAG TPA: hypothetical protein [Caudoviricetes sp.]DAY00938.1 MAG TPA: hypothetical protein [Caudoviricetes sp.]